MLKIGLATTWFCLLAVVACTARDVRKIGTEHDAGVPTSRDASKPVAPGVDGDDPDPLCIAQNLGSSLGDAVATGSTSAGANLTSPPSKCARDSNAPEHVMKWTAPANGRYIFSLYPDAGFNAVLYARSSCWETDTLACNDDVSDTKRASQVTLDVLDGQEIFLYVDGRGAETGAFSLSISDAIPTHEVSCYDGVDNDLDGVADCGDYDCARLGNADCVEVVCDDDFDNDGDGQADCADADCAIDPSCPEDCDDGVDNNANGIIDCSDVSCLKSPDCIEICDDGIDNNANGEIDCRDVRCPRAPGCFEICDDGIDNDRNGRIDCFDHRCHGTPACTEICDDGIDNDRNGTIDCRDYSCTYSDRCVEICNDGIDNDRDGDVDCDDSVCDFECLERCDDDIDNDVDGLVDCADRDDCEDDPSCFEEDCADAIDGYGDVDADCEDEDCSRTMLCEGEDCDNGIDDNSDGRVDCDDPGCDEACDV